MKIKNTKLKTLKLSDDLNDRNQRFTLDATYEVEYENGCIEEIEYYRIVLPIFQTSLPAPEVEVFSSFTSRFCNFGFGSTSLLPNHKGDVCVSRIIKKPDPKEMTLDELEQVVGFPFKIVKEK